MGHPLDSANFRRLLDNRLREVATHRMQYNALKSMVPVLCKEVSSDSAWEEFYSIGGVPDIPAFNGRLATLSMFPGFHAKIEPTEYAGQLQAQRKLLDDKKYGVLEDFAQGLVDSADRVKEKALVKIFANITSTAFDFMTTEEGVSLASTAHLTKTPGVSTSTGFSNAGTSPLNKTSVAATRLLMRRFKDDIGERFEMSDNLGIIHPDSLSDAVAEIIGTQSGLNSAEGNINPQFQRHTSIPYMRLDDYSTTSWGMVDVDRMKKDLVWINRINNDLKNTVDWSTYAYMQAIYLRFGAGFLNWRWIYWHTV